MEICSEMHGGELGIWQLYQKMTILHCFTTFGVGSTVFRSNNTTLLSVVEMLTPFCGEQ